MGSRIEGGVMSAPDYLSEILERKRGEVARRKHHCARYVARVQDAASEPGAFAVRALRRSAGQPLHVIAEIKRRSPSAGVLRAAECGDVARIAGAYVAGGASAISVLCDGPGFGGSPLDLRRAARAVSVPLLFKEFVLDEVQLRVARAVGAHMALLLVRALPGRQLSDLVEAAMRHGLAPVVEAADETELDAALATRAVIVGVNARDLKTFRVDPARAAHAVARIPSDRIAVHMSGVHTREDFQRVAAGRADAVLIGEGLMRAADLAARLRELSGA